MLDRPPRHARPDPPEPPRGRAVGVAVAALLAGAGVARADRADPGPLPPRHADWPPRGGPTLNPIVSGPHDDEGPDGRYDAPYVPITYGRACAAPLPNLGYSFALADWDGDGLTDVLSNLRRGGGVVLYRNVGTGAEPKFRPLHENRVLLRDDRFGRFFDVIDVNGDGGKSLVAFAKLGAGQRPRLVVFRDLGEGRDSRWEPTAVHTPDGGFIEPPTDDWHGPRVRVADWDGDGRDDVILAWDRVEEAVPGEQKDKGARIGRWLPPDQVNAEHGRVLVALNRTEPGGPPTFAAPEELVADGRPMRVHHMPYPAVADLDGDGRADLLLGAEKPGLRQYLCNPDGTLRDAGPLLDAAGEPIRTTLAQQPAFADLTGGAADLVTSSYFGNANRFLLFTGPDFADAGALSIDAGLDTPVYGMGNSTVDVADFDGDGTQDLILGAERGVPTVAINVGTDERPAYEGPHRLKFADGSPFETYAIENGEGSHWGVGEWYADRLTPRLVDWDGDGVPDLISGSMGRRLYFARGVRVDGELRFERPVNLRHGGTEFAVPDRIMPAVLDWDGDGTPDLVMTYDATDSAGRHPDNGQVRVYPGTPGDPLTLGDPVVLRQADGEPLRVRDYWGRTKGNRSSVAVHDWTGDGRPDLIATMFHRGVYLAAGRGDGTFDDWVPLVEPLYSHNPGVSVFDYDRDGVPDLVVGGDERRMIEPARPAHLVYFRGQDTLRPPGESGPSTRPSP